MKDLSLFKCSLIKGTIHPIVQLQTLQGIRKAEQKKLKLKLTIIEQLTSSFWGNCDTFQGSLTKIKVGEGEKKAGV